MSPIATARPRIIRHTRRHLAAAVLTLSATLVGAQTFSVGLLDNRRAQASLADGLDLDLLSDTALTGQRLLNSRLGALTGTTLNLNLVYTQNIQLLDPGVAEPPGAYRELMQVDQRTTLTGAAIEALNGGAPWSQNTSLRWICEAPALQCSSAMVSTARTLSPPTGSLAQPTSLLSGLRLSLAPATLTPLAAGVQVLPDTEEDGYSAGGLTLSLRLTSTYTAKSPLAYAGDALLATSAAAAGSGRSSRLQAALNDIGALRHANYGTLAGGLEQINSAVQTLQPLRDAEALLSHTRDLAQWREAVDTGVTTFSTGSSLAAQAWNLAALAEPSGGRTQAGGASGGDALQQLAALNAVLGAADDTSLQASWAALLASPPAAGPQALLRFDGALFGMTGAEVSLYLVQGNGYSGTVMLDLAAAQSHALLRSSTYFDRLSFVAGAAAGLRVQSEASGVDQTLALGEEAYLGENYSGLLWLGTQGMASTIALNNFYSDSLVLVASYGVAAVPEPATLALWAAGLAGLAWRRRGAKTTVRT